MFVLICFPIYFSGTIRPVQTWRFTRSRCRVPRDQMAGSWVWNTETSLFPSGWCFLKNKLPPFVKLSWWDERTWWYIIHIHMHIHIHIHILIHIHIHIHDLILEKKQNLSQVIMSRHDLLVSLLFQEQNEHRRLFESTSMTMCQMHPRFLTGIPSLPDIHCWSKN